MHKSIFFFVAVVVSCNILLQVSSNLAACFQRETPPGVSDDIHALEITAPLEQSLLVKSAKYRVKVDLGTVSAKTRYKLDLTITNPYRKDIPFDGVESHCKCGNLTTLAGIIPGNGKMNVQVEFRTHPDSEYGSFAFIAKCLNGKDPSIELMFYGKLSSNLYTPSHTAFEVGDEPKELLIPINFTKPIDRNDLVVEGSENLAASNPELIELEDKQYIRFTIEPEMIEGSYLAGQFFVKHESLKLLRETSVMLSRKLPFQISPQVLHFRKQNDGDSLVANAMLKINESEKKKDDLPRLKSNAVPRLSIKSQDVNFKIEQKKLADGIYRLKILVDANQADQLNQIKELTCHLKSDNDTFSQRLIISGDNQ